MRTGFAVIGMALLGIASVIPVFAEQAFSAAPVTAQAKEVAEKKSPDAADKQEQGSDAPVPAAQAGSGSLLPVRPKDFNPLMPPGDTGMDMGGIDNIQQMNAASIFMAELRVYTLQLTFFTRWLAVIAIAGAVLFVLQLIYLRRNAVAMRILGQAAGESLEIAAQHLKVVREGLRSELRAYVHNIVHKGEMPTEKSGKYTVRAEVRNFGKTPAHSVCGWMMVFVGDLVYEKDIQHQPPRDSEIVQTVLPPGGVCYFYAQTFEPIAHEVKAIAASVRAIYAYGEIRYKDIFGTERYSRFRIKCCGERNLASGSFNYCVSGNESS